MLFQIASRANAMATIRTKYGAKMTSGFTATTSPPTAGGRVANAVFARERTNTTSSPATKENLERIPLINIIRLVDATFEDKILSLAVIRIL